MELWERRKLLKAQKAVWTLIASLVASLCYGIPLDITFAMTRGGPYDVVSLLAALLGFPARGLAGYMGLPHTELPREIIPPFPTRHHRVQSAL